jgi:hypothetical protein
MHSFRHTVASRALLAGESIDEIAFLLAIATQTSLAPCTCASLPMFGDAR